MLKTKKRQQRTVKNIVKLTDNIVKMYGKHKEIIFVTFFIEGFKME